jgi:type II secretory pathway pseudopilin PulG
MINRLKLKFNRGFTLVEMLIAVLLLMTAVTGPLTIASRGLTASIIAQDQVTALYLAQDAVEYVRFVRDTNRLTGHPWLSGLDGTDNGGVTTLVGSPATCVDANGLQACYIDSILSKIDNCNSNSCSSPLKYDSTNGYYSIVSGIAPAQQFRRTVRIITPYNGNADEAQLTVTVTWLDQANITRQVQVRENLFNWE